MVKYPKFIVSLLFFLALLGSMSSAVAEDCTKDGATYSPGTEIGGFVCTEDGTWIKK